MHPAALERAVLAFIGVCFIAFGVATNAVFHEGRPPIDFMPNMWPALFIAAGITTIWWAERPTNYRAFQASGVLCMTALISRAVNLTYLIYVPNTLTDPVQSRLAMGIISYLCSAVLLAYTWHRLWPRTVRLNSGRSTD